MDKKEFVNRFDVGRLDGPVKTENGFLRGDAFVTRTGVFKYRNPDGTVRHELRHPSEVFNQDSLKSLSMAPLTLYHPKEMVTSKNAKEYSIGATGESPRQDGKFIRTPLSIMDEKAVAAVESGGLRELSCGYTANVFKEDGEYNGEKYTHVQRNIRYNHVAIVAKGRAGADVAIHLDADDAVITDVDFDLPSDLPQGDKQEPRNKEQNTMEKIVIDGVDYECPAQLKKVLEKTFAKNDESLEKNTKELETTKAKVDTLTEELDKLKKDHAEATSAEAIEKKVRARVDLESKATKVLGESKFDGKSDLEIKKDVILKVFPEAKLDDKSEVYIDARYDSVLEYGKKTNESLDKLRTVVDGAAEPKKDSAGDARQRMINDQLNAWKPKQENA